MKKIILSVFAMAIVSITAFSCSDDETKTVTVDSSLPDGNFSVSKMGTLIAQNGTPTKGKIEIGTDSKGATFVHLGTDFTTELGTGTATVYLSKTATFTASPSTGNPDLKLVGVVNRNGEFYFKLNSVAPTGLNYIIIWCASANVPFGNGELK
jgi:hypothetical protein